MSKPTFAREETASTDDGSDAGFEIPHLDRGRVGSKRSLTTHSDCTWKTADTSASRTEGHGVMNGGRVNLRRVGSETLPPTTRPDCTSLDIGTTAKDFAVRGEKKSVMAVCFTAETSGAVWSGTASTACPCRFLKAVSGTMTSCDRLKTQRLFFPGCCSEALIHSQCWQQDRMTARVSHTFPPLTKMYLRRSGHSASWGSPIPITPASSMLQCDVDDDVCQLSR